tara:strand:+ start:753 stop:941 length:189 start_codon:yes stop_codon:yes gene_type:complete
MKLNPAIKAMRQREYDVVIAHRQDIGLLTLGPLLHGAALTLWAVTITTAKVAWLYMSAVGAL